MKIVSRALVATIILAVVIGVVESNERMVFLGMANALPPEKEEKQQIILKPGNYTVKTNVAFKLESEKRKAIAEFFDLEWSKDKVSAADFGSEGWIVKGKNYFWGPGEGKSSIDIPLTLKPSEQTYHVTDFDEILVEYQDLFPENPSNLSMAITLSGVTSPPGNSKANAAQSGKKILRAGNERSAIIGQKKLAVDGSLKIMDRDLKVIDTVELPLAAWTKKNYFYVFKRILGLPFDSTWYYDQNGPDAFLQRRFHLDLASVETVDLMFREDLKVIPWKYIVKTGNHLFSCSLRVGFGSRSKQSQIIPCGNKLVPSIISSDRPMLRVELGDFVRGEYEAGEKNVILEEIIVHLPGQKSALVANRPPLEKIVFQKWDKSDKDKKLKEHTKNRWHRKVAEWRDKVRSRNEELEKRKLPPIMDLPVKIESLSHGAKRFVMLDLRGLVGYIGGNTTMDKIALSLQAEDPWASSGVHLRHVRMVKREERQRYLFLTDGEQLSSRWGGPFLKLAKKGNQVEWIQIGAYLPFEGGGRQKAANSIVVGETVIKAENPLSARRLPDAGFEIEGTGNWVDIDWPIRAQTGEETRFYLDIPKGSESIVRLRVEPYSRGFILPTIQAFPNAPVQINSGNVDGLKIRIELDGRPFHITFKEMVLFRPTALTPAEAVDAPRLVWEETPLIPANINVSTSKLGSNSSPVIDGRIDNGRLTGSASGNLSAPLSWPTKVERKVSWVRGIRVRHQKIPPPADPCRLNLILDVSGHQVERTVCLNATEGQSYIPATDLFRDMEIKAEDVLHDIVAYWGDPMDSLDLAMTLDGVDMRSIRGDLLKYPLARWNDQKFFPLSIADLPAEAFFGDNYWVDLGSLTVSDDATKGSFVFQSHPYLASKKVVFEKPEFLGETWVSVEPGQSNIDPVTTPTKPFSGLLRRVKVLLGFSIFVMFWWIWKRKYVKQWQEACAIRAAAISCWAADLRKACLGKMASIALRVRAARRISSARRIRVARNDRIILELYQACSSWVRVINRSLGVVVVGISFWAGNIVDDLNVRDPVFYIASLFMLLVLRHEVSCRSQYMDSPSTRGSAWFFGRVQDVPYVFYFATTAIVGWVVWRIGVGGRHDVLSIAVAPLELLGYLYFPWIFGKTVVWLWSRGYWLRSFYYRLRGVCYWLWCGYYWLWERYYWLWERYYRLWVFIAVGFYLASLLVSGVYLKSYFSMAGSVFMILAWRDWILFFRSHLEGRWPVLAEKIFCGEGSHYIAGFLLFTLMGVISRSIKLQTVAEQFAVAGFAMLAIGVIAEILASRKKRQKGYDPLMAEEAPCA